MFTQVMFPAVWGPMFNLSNGKLVVDEQTFSLVPNTALKVMALSVGKKAYSSQTFPIDAITGYESNFMAWMSILFRDGSKVKVSIGSKSKKREIIAALEERRSAIFAAKGQSAPQLSVTI